MRTHGLRAYNLEGQLISLLDTGAKGESLQHFRYNYDAAGLLIKENETRYEYNAWGALTVVNSRKYKYDLSGNMTSAVDGDQLLEMAYAADNRLRSVNGQDVDMDEDGNLLHAPLRGRTQSFSYDARNRLVQAASIRYGYNADNERTWMIVNGETRRFVVNPHSEYSQLLLETDEQGRMTAAYVYGLGLIGREDADGSYQTYHYDLRGSTTLLTDEKGCVTDRYTYGAFGELLNHEGDARQPFAYNGRDGVQTDINGLYYMRARYYNPELKRFLNRDILRGDISKGLSMNRYAYVEGNPVTFVDPLGLDKIQAGKSGGKGETPLALPAGKAPPGSSLIIEHSPNPKMKFSDSELKAANYMYERGNQVVLRHPVGTRADGGTSNLLVNGTNYDVYTPITKDASRIIGSIAKKNSQTTGIVLDLSETPVTPEQLGNVLGRVQGIITKGGKTPNITDIIIMP